MKKLLGIVVLGLLWCNVSFAENIYILCLAEYTKVEPFSTKKGPGKDFGFFSIKLDKKKSEALIYAELFPAGPQYKLIKTKVKKKKLENNEDLEIKVNKKKSKHKIEEITISHPLSSPDGYENTYGIPKISGHGSFKESGKTHSFSFAGKCLVKDKNTYR